MSLPSRTAERTAGLAERLYGLLLLAYPARLRRRFGAEMRRLFRDSWRAEAHSPAAALRCLGRAVGDVLVNASLAHFEAIRPTPASSGPAPAHDATPDHRGRHTPGGLMDGLLYDLRLSLRSLARTPTLSLVVVATLALGIGANTALFSVIDGVLLRPLPYEEPERLVMLWENDRLRGTVQEGVSGPDFLDWQERTRSFSALAAMSPASVTVIGGNAEPQTVTGYSVSHDLFETLGVEPTLGRDVRPEDDRTGAEPVAVLSYGVWQSNFGGGEVLGQSLTLDGVPHTIVGVMPQGFSFPEPGVAVWAALHTGPRKEMLEFRGNHTIYVLGRLRDGVSVESASEELAGVMTHLEEAHPDDNLGRGAWAEPLADVYVAEVRPALLALLGAVGLVLFIACANVANLLLSRAATREREIAVRSALGADRWRVARQSLTESTLLAMAGGGLGIGVAVLTLHGLLGLAGDTLPRSANVTIDLRVLLFTLGLSMLTGLVFGTLPAVHAARTDVQDRLRDGARSGTGRGRQRLRRTLVVAELGLAVVLLVGAGLLLQSLWRLQQVDPGFRVEGLVATSVVLPKTSYPQAFEDFPDWHAIIRFQKELLQRLRTLPGVTGVALAQNHPLDPGWTTRFTIDGRPEVAAGEQDEVRLRAVTPGYFQVAGIPLLRGRDLDERDDEAAPLVTLINESMVRSYFADQDPIGQRITIWHRSFEIVGVVADVKFRGPRQAVPIAFYPPLAQLPMPEAAAVLRSDLELGALARAVQAEIRALDPELPLAAVVSLESVLSSSVAPARFNATVLGVFAGVALLLAALGIYGVVSFAVTERRREIGLRMSLGARRLQIQGQVLAQGLVLTTIGLGLGLAAALALGKVLESLLFGVATTDGPTLVGVMATLAAVTLVASYLPARRASRVDPAETLRHE